jgi:hypothetical protein
MGSDTETKILHESRLGAAKSEPCLCINRHRCNGDLRIIHPPHAKGSQAPSGVREESADMYHDHRHRGQDKSEKWPPTGLRIGLPGNLALRCAAFSKCSATQHQTPRETIVKASWVPFSDLSWPRCIWSWAVSARSLQFRCLETENQQQQQPPQ